MVEEVRHCFSGRGEERLPSFGGGSRFGVEEFPGKVLCRSYAFPFMS